MNLNNLFKKAKKKMEEYESPKDMKGMAEHAMDSMKPSKKESDKEAELEIEIMINGSKKKKK